MAKNRTYSSNIPKDALDFVCNGYNYTRLGTFKVGNDYKHDFKDRDTKEIFRDLTLEQLKKLKR